MLRASRSMRVTMSTSAFRRKSKTVCNSVRPFVAVLVAERLQRCFVAVDHHHARDCGQHRLRASQSDARRSPGYDGNLAFQFSSISDFGIESALLTGVKH